MGKPKGATQARKAERVSMVLVLFAQGIRSVHQILGILQKEYGISERTAKRDLQEAITIIRTISYGHRDENIGAARNMIYALYAQARSTNSKDFELPLQFIDRLIRLQAVEDKVRNVTLPERRNTHEPSSSEENELEAFLQLFETVGETDKPQEP
jgi:hypothetical protein